MKQYVTSIALLMLAAFFAAPLSANTILPGSTPTTGTNAKPHGTVTVNPPGQGSQNGITATNGDYAGDYPQYGGSTGSVKLKKKLNDATHSEVKGENGFRGRIAGIETGDTVEISVNSNSDISGTGGTVNLAAGSTITVTNTNPVGGGGDNITVHAGSATITVVPGATVPIAN